MPNPFVVEWCQNLAPGAALDIACGSGRNSVYLARLSFSVTAIDISEEALTLAKARSKSSNPSTPIQWIQQDLDHPTLPPHQYDLIIMLRYVNSNLIQQLPDHLKPGGLLLIEQHLQTTTPVSGPKKPNFRVAPNALKNQLPPTCHLTHYQETLTKTNNSLWSLAQVTAPPAKPGASEEC
ncbi:MAG: class I SAM-dependent methyltransferase, partial [Proteobacteria bacterium]|nr:class I SAM-dependent methyltransferase [Pseudomonadota bacterium]